MSRNEVRTWNAERFGHDVEGPCWNCGQAVAYFVDEMGTPREIRGTERRLTVDEVNKHWDALIAQAVAGELTDRQLIQAMNGYFDNLATAAVDEEEA